MKYKTMKLNDGRYAVATGQSYFTNLVYETEAEADRQAIIESARWHHEKSQDCLWKLNEKYGVEPIHFGDYLC